MMPSHPLGPFFAVEAFDEATGAGSGWRPLGADLTDAGFVEAWVGRAWTRVGGSSAPSPSDRRTLGAVLHLGVLARLVSPWIGHFLLDGDVVVPDLDRLWWRDDGTTMFPLAVVQPGKDTTPTHALRGERPGVEEFARDLLREIVGPLDSAAFTPSAAIRRGNAASAINTAAGLVRRQERLDSGRTARTSDLVTSCLGLLGESVPPTTGEPMTTGFRRTSCCLAYALPGRDRHAVCGDCVLRA